MHIIQNANMTLLSIDTSLMWISYLVFFVSIILALVYIYKLVESKKNLKKAKRLYPDLIKPIEKDIKKYTILLISVLILGFAQLIAVLCMYGMAFREQEQQHQRNSESSQPLTFIMQGIDV